MGAERRHVYGRVVVPGMVITSPPFTGSQELRQNVLNCADDCLHPLPCFVRVQHGLNDQATDHSKFDLLDPHLLPTG
jgi:hypothetical protein